MVGVGAGGGSAVLVPGSLVKCGKSHEPKGKAHVVVELSLEVFPLPLAPLF